MTAKPFVFAATVAVLLGGCANMNNTEQRVLSGGAGAATGYIIDQTSDD